MHLWMGYDFCMLSEGSTDLSAFPAVYTVHMAQGDDEGPQVLFGSALADGIGEYDGWHTATGQTHRQAEFYDYDA